MADFIGEQECVTHHHACDCREARFKQIEDVLRELVEAVADNKSLNILRTFEAMQLARQLLEEQ